MGPRYDSGPSCWRPGPAPRPHARPPSERRAANEVLSGAKVTDVAGRYAVSRQSVHAWVRRYQAGGPAGLADRSHAPKAHPMQTPAAIEALICELRRAHPRWGTRTLLWELGRRGVEPLPFTRGLLRPDPYRQDPCADGPDLDG
ncbi:helix-turn-helix domain-containing protein [Nonomuraea jabiensis]|uniref:helix-turn-helix domain-containing protein n=1 Tax=Nonomuraea jabiensis TaxID=882448 RepID=UPI003D737709